MNTKSNIINKINYWLIISLLTIFNMYANAGNSESKPATSTPPQSVSDAVKEHLPQELVKLVEDYAYPTNVYNWDTWDTHIIAVTDDKGVTWKPINKDSFLEAILENNTGSIVAVMRDLNPPPNTPQKLFIYNTIDSIESISQTKPIESVAASKARMAMSPNGGFAILFDEHLLYKSDNGSHWEKTFFKDIPDIQDMRDIVMDKNGNVFILTDTNLVKLKPNGTAQLISPCKEMECFLLKLVVNKKNEFVLFRNYVDDSNKTKFDLQTSKDGLNWKTNSNFTIAIKSMPDYDFFGSHTPLDISFAVNYKNDRFLVVINEDYGHSKKTVVISSPDGITWDNSKIRIIPGFFSARMLSVTGNNTFFLARSGLEAIKGGKNLISSNDGVNWYDYNGELISIKPKLEEKKDD